MGWTDERVELLKKLWADGLSASRTDLRQSAEKALIGFGDCRRVGEPVADALLAKHPARLRLGLGRRRLRHRRPGLSSLVGLITLVFLLLRYFSCCVATSSSTHVAPSCARYMRPIARKDSVSAPGLDKSGLSGSGSRSGAGCRGGR